MSSNVVSPYIYVINTNTTVYHVPSKPWRRKETWRTEEEKTMRIVLQLLKPFIRHPYFISCPSWSIIPLWSEYCPDAQTELKKGDDTLSFSHNVLTHKAVGLPKGYLTHQRSLSHRSIRMIFGRGWARCVPIKPFRHICRLAYSHMVRTPSVFGL